MRDIIKEELSGPSVIKDEAKLQFDYVPEELPHRREAMRQLARVFRPILTTPSGANALITGPVGTGKTALSRRFAMEFQRAAADESVKVEFVHVNCRRRNTEAAALLKVLSKLVPHFPDRGFSNSEMLEALRKQLARREAHLIVILDEVDVLLKKSGSDLIYNLTRFNEEETNPQHSVSLIMVSQGDARKHLDEAAASTFKRTNVVKLDRYGREALRAIVEQRVGLAFHAGTFPEELQDLVADIAASEGDARFAIEILHKSGAAADGEGSGHVEAEHVRAAKAETNPYVTESKLVELTQHNQLTLLAIARELKKGGAYATTGEVEERYELACEEYDERPRAHTQFWTYLKELEAAGVIETKKSGKGVLGTTTLISLPDVPARVLEEKLQALLTGGAAG